jgi:hypothetical protein
MKYLRYVYVKCPHSDYESVIGYTRCSFGIRKNYTQLFLEALVEGASIGCDHLRGSRLPGTAGTRMLLLKSKTTF